MSKKSKKLVKRGFKQWKSILLFIGNPVQIDKFWEKKRLSPKMSDNRIAYYVLKSNYSTTALNHFMENYEMFASQLCA